MFVYFEKSSKSSMGSRTSKIQTTLTILKFVQKSLKNDNELTNDSKVPGSLALL